LLLLFVDHYVYNFCLEYKPQRCFSYRGSISVHTFDEVKAKVATFGANIQMTTYMLELNSKLAVLDHGCD
jgi:hypothetical protein